MYCPLCFSDEVEEISYEDYEGRPDGSIDWMPTPITVPALKCRACGATTDLPKVS